MDRVTEGHTPFARPLGRSAGAGAESTAARTAARRRHRAPGGGRLQPPDGRPGRAVPHNARDSARGTSGGLARDGGQRVGAAGARGQWLRGICGDADMGREGGLWAPTPPRECVWSSHAGAMQGPTRTSTCSENTHRRTNMTATKSLTSVRHGAIGPQNCTHEDNIGHIPWAHSLVHREEVGGLCLRVWLWLWFVTVAVAVDVALGLAVVVAVAVAVAVARPSTNF